MVKHWLNRTAADATGLTFVKWQETEHDEMIFNSCELRAVGFPLEQIGGQTQSQPSAGAGTHRLARAEQELALPSSESNRAWSIDCF